MNGILKGIKQLNWNVICLLCIIPGLAPFTPPHLFEKLGMLVQGNLVRAIDWFDLFFHAMPWALALTRLVLDIRET